MNRNERLLLENILLCDPVSKRGRAALNSVKSQINKDLTIKDFYEQVYAHPFFVELKNVGNDFGIFNMDRDSFSFTITGSDIENLNDKKERFESFFNEKRSNELLFIKASAGSGKSIYLNYLKRERRKIYHPELINCIFLNNTINEAYELNFDLERSSQSIDAGGLHFPFNYYRCIKNNEIVFNSQWNFYTMILQSIFDNCYKLIVNNKINKEKVNNNFNRIYGIDYSDQVKELFDFISNTIYTSSLEDQKEIRRTLLKSIANACFEDTTDTILNIKKALEVLFRLLSIITDLDNPNQTLISFDNIEHLIDNKKRIFDEDISKIVEVVSLFTESENKYFEEKGLNFAEFFKIVLVIRDTTEKMLYDNVHDHFIHDDSSINIAGWFLLEKIYSNKLNYFDLDKNLSSVKFIDLITNDSLDNLKNSLMNQISIMYNHNNRRTTRMLTRISTLFDQLDLNSSVRQDSIRYETYEKLWEWPGKRHIKFLCRQSVLRLIYNIIENTHYFDRLCININKCGSPQNTYARRVLTWLSNNESHKNQEYYTFKEIIDNVLKSPDVNEYTFNDQRLFELCNVLIALDEYRFAYDNELLKRKNEPGPNCWCQLAIIKYNDKFAKNQLTTEMLADEIKKQYFNANSSNLGVRLTESGYFLANKYLDYEFFSCLYTGSRYPLIFMTNKEKIVETIRHIYYTAEKAIKMTIQFESHFFPNDCYLSYRKLYHLKIKSNNNNQIYQSIPFRIINLHSTYLESYRQYITDDALHESLKIFDKSTRDYIEKNVQYFINQYLNIRKQITGSNLFISENGDKVGEYILYQPE